jgi:hypothetical protein
MKKLIASFTFIVYFAFACGVMVNYHYCMDRYTSFGLFTSASDQCSTCGMQIDHKGCCHDEIKIVKLQNDYQTSSFAFVCKLAAPTIFIHSEFLVSPLYNEKNELNKTNHSPPLLPFHDIYLQDCTFRI